MTKLGSQNVSRIYAVQQLEIIETKRSGIEKLNESENAQMEVEGSAEWEESETTVFMPLFGVVTNQLMPLSFQNQTLPQNHSPERPLRVAAISHPHPSSPLHHPTTHLTKPPTKRTADHQPSVVAGLAETNTPKTGIYLPTTTYQQQTFPPPLATAPKIPTVACPTSTVMAMSTQKPMALASHRNPTA